MSSHDEMPPELRGVDWSQDDSAPRRSPVVMIVAWVCILGLVLGVGAGILSAL